MLGLDNTTVRKTLVCLNLLDNGFKNLVRILVQTILSECWELTVVCRFHATLFRPSVVWWVLSDCVFLVVRGLDDRVHFVQKPIERPGSGSGRGSAIFERPPSHSGSYEDSRNTEFMQRPRSRGTGDRSGSFEDSRNTEYMQRPRSRGTGDALPGQQDEWRGFEGSKGFLGSRNLLKICNSVTWTFMR